MITNVKGEFSERRAGPSRVLQHAHQQLHVEPGGSREPDDPGAHSVVVADRPSRLRRRTRALAGAHRRARDAGRRAGALSHQRPGAGVEWRP